MNSSGSLIVLALAGTVGLAQDAHSQASDPFGPGEVAILDGERVPESLFRLFTLEVMELDPDSLTPEARTDVINRLVSIVLLASEAERSGLDRERRVAAEIELLRLQTLASYMAERHASENPPTDAELRVLYEELLPELRRTEYKTRHILVETEARADDLIDELDDGADFAALARERSTGATAPAGGDLGWITPDSVVEPLGAVLDTATPGVHLPRPVQTQYGWHVILVEETREQALDFEAVRADLAAVARNQKVAAFVSSLREAAEVRIVE